MSTHYAISPAVAVTLDSVVSRMTLHDAGYRCRLEPMGAGMDAAIYVYRVRRPDGRLAVYGVSTHRTARAAWAEAIAIAAREG